MKKLISSVQESNLLILSTAAFIAHKFADSDWRSFRLRVADLNVSSGAYTGRKSVLDSTSSNCSVSELHSIINLSQATARIEISLPEQPMGSVVSGS